MHPTLVSYVSFRHLSILEVERCAPWCGTWRSVTMPTYCIFMRLWWVTFWVEFHLERQSRVMYLMVRHWRTSHTFTSCTSNISVSCPHVHRPCPFVQTVWESIEPPDWCRLLTIAIYSISVDLFFPSHPHTHPLWGGSIIHGLHLRSRYDRP